LSPTNASEQQILGVLSSYDQRKAAEASKPQQNQGPIGGGVFGTILNNVLKPLEFLDKGRRIVTLGAEELAEAIGGREFASQVDPKTGKVLDTRSNWDKINDPRYGVGQLLGGTVGNITPWKGDDEWLNRISGFVGDVALDPLSYVSGIGGAVTKGGIALNKANRAGLAARALDAGNSATDVERFVRRGAGAVSDDFLSSIGAQRSAIRFNGPLASRNHISVKGPSSGPGLSVLATPGRVGDIARNTAPGRRMAALRTPKGLEESFDRLFHASGAMTTPGAANRVAIENATRVAQNTFKQVGAESLKPLRQKLQRLRDANKALIVDSVETGTPFADEALEALRGEYVKFLDELWVKAEAAGLNIAKRENYSPHILTRDAAKWLRNNGEQANRVGLVTEDLYHPSGVTMRRQFQPGQTIEVNGTPVRFDPGQPVTIEQVNRKFRDAGLNFDFYEHDPAIALEKYLDMLSSDVGQAVGIMSRAGKGSIRELTDEEMAMLGQSVLLRGGGKVQDGDIDEIRRQLGVEAPAGQPEILTAQPSMRVEPQRTKGGKTKLTQQGKTRLARGVTEADAENLDIEPLVRWADPIDETREYNKAMAAQAAEQSRRTGLVMDDTADTVDRLLTGTARDVQQQLTKSFEEARSTMYAARRKVIEMIEQVRSKNLQGEQLESAIAQIDRVMEDIANDIPAMDQALARAQDRARSQAIRQERDKLVKEYERLTAQIDDLRQGMRSGRASWLSSRADDLDAATRAPVEQARKAHDEAREAAADRVGLNQAIQARQKAIDEAGFARAQVDRGKTTQKRLDALVAKVKNLDDKVGRLSREVDADAAVVAAKRELSNAERHAARVPSTGAGTPNVKPPKLVGKEAEILTGSQPIAPPPPRAGELDDLLSQQARLGEREVALREAIDAGKEAVEKSKPVTAANKKVLAARGPKNQAALKKAEANLAAARRAEAETRGLPAMVSEYEKVKQQLNQANRRISQIDEYSFNSKSVFADEAAATRRKGATPDQVAAARKATRETMERNLDPGAQRRAEQLRAEANEAAGAGPRLIPGLAAQRDEIGQELTGIVNDPAVREAATQRGVDRLTKPIRDRQAEPRYNAALITGEDGFGRKLTGRRKAYAAELAEINKSLGDSYRILDEALTNRAAADEVFAESQRLVNKVNREVLGELDEGGQPLLANAPSRVEGMDAYERATLANVDALNSIIDASDLPIDVKVTAQHYLNQAIEAQEELRRLDLTQKRWESMREAGKRGELGRVVEAILDDGWSIPYPHLVGDNIAMSDELHRSFQQVRSAAFHKDFWPVIDTFTNLFKTYATLTPGFHVRNAMSAAFVNSAEGVPLKTQMRGARLMAAFRRADDPGAWLAKQDEDVRQAFEAAFGSGIGGRYTERGIGERGSARYKLSEKLFSNPVTRGGQWLGGMVEGSVRLPVALDAIAKGGSVEDALIRVTHRHFDYSQVSQFDEVAKRFIPFWTFMSRNLPLQMTMMYTQPRTFAKYNSFIRNARGDDEPGTPTYFAQTDAFRFGNASLGGLPMYLQPDFAHSRLDEDIEKILNITQNPGRMLSDFNPLLTAPIEFTTGKDIYTGRTFRDDDVRTTGLLETPIMLAAMASGNTKKTPEGNVAVEERFINMMRSLIPAYDRSVRLAPGAVTGDADRDANNRQLESYLRFFGFPVRQLSPEQQRAALRSGVSDQRREADLRRALALIDANS